MIPTYGLTHIALAVRNAKESLRFYRKVFGVKVTYESEGWIEVQTPGKRDIISFIEGKPNPGKMGGIAHFGFRLRKPTDIHAAIKKVEEAGGKILEQGHFTPDEPYAFVKDPDGYVVEIWYEPRKRRPKR
ncbi:MAG: VOC family protein [Ignavibacteriae bacterium]|nr:VOC family protein [Ignavibacteriota bacterium]